VVELDVVDEAELFRQVLTRSFGLMRERDLEPLRRRLVSDTLELLDATVARVYEPDPDGAMRLAWTDELSVRLPAVATRMEQELLPRALAADKSLISTHPLLDRDLAQLARSCFAAGITTHLLLLRAAGVNVGAVAVHWVGVERPAPYLRRAGFYAYWDNAGFVFAVAQERARAESELAALRRTAFTDRLTELPNARALEHELDVHSAMFPFSVLALDFDGMREANTALGYSEGGDVLISTVGRGLARLARANEFPARLHTAGDEFVLLLPGQDETAAGDRRAALEHALTGLSVPASFHQLYRGATVGHATRRPGETTRQVLDRAIETMRERKAARRNP
jgi:diguanylate cyclase (GGDEF)-like protein